jgi:hypothetical protein
VSARSSIFIVMRGLDPRIQLFSISIADKLDCRIKSGNDAVGVMRLEKQKDSRGLVPAIQVFLAEMPLRRGCPAQGRA